MNSRVDSLLAELGARHGVDDRFLSALRPSIERVLDPATPDETRPALLELVAETCERQIEIERNSAALRTALIDYFDSLRKLLEHYRDRARRNGDDAS